MRKLKTFSFAAGWQMTLSEEEGRIDINMTNGVRQLVCRTADGFELAWPQEEHTFRMIGSRVQTEETENSLTLHTCPVDSQTGAPLTCVTAHYRFEVAGSNALRVTFWLSCRTPLPLHSLSWMALQMEADCFDTCHGFNPDWQTRTAVLSHPVHFGSTALSGEQGYVMLSSCGEARYMPRFEADGVCALVPMPGHIFNEHTAILKNLDASLLDEAHALSALISFGEETPCLPQTDEAVSPLLPLCRGECHTLTSGRLTMAVYARQDGVSMANLSLDTLDALPERAGAPLASLQVRELATGRTLGFTAEFGWDRVSVQSGKREMRIVLAGPQGLPISICIYGRAKAPDTIAWTMQVINDSPDHSVLSAAWPGVGFSGGNPVFFKPVGSGCIEPEPYLREERWRGSWPSGFYSVSPVIGIYDPQKKHSSGLYIALHFPQAERSDMVCSFFRGGHGYASFDYPAQRLGQPCNCFQPAGELVVRVLDGDWYDMACIYQEYVSRNADWYATLGREDSPAWMRDVPMYAMDWMPNDNPDAEPVPISIRPPAEPPRDNWYQKPVALADQLGLPIGYHLYNWHAHPFNNDFPDYFPVKDGLAEGVEKMHQHGVHVMPYINARIVDTRTRDLSTESFEKRFAAGATRQMDGSLNLETYASRETDGSLCRLAAMCPSTHVWRETLAGVVRRLFREFKMDAVYLDQVAAGPVNLCCADNHPHQPGNGTWWVKGYRTLMTRLKQECLPGCGFTTESNAEVYADQFDGFLTWAWVYPNMVPFFPKVYTGRIAMLGRNTNGYKKHDRQFFRFHVGQAVMFGQQIGWINADVADDQEKMLFLSRMCHLRWDYKDYFSEGNMLRPPVSQMAVPMFLTDSSMGMDEMLPAPLVCASAWQMGEKQLLLFVNTGTEETTLSFDCCLAIRPHASVVVYGDGAVVEWLENGMKIRLGAASAIAVEQSI